MLHLLFINIIDPYFEPYFAVLLFKFTDIALYPPLLYGKMKRNVQLTEAIEPFDSEMMTNHILRNKFL